MARRGFLSFYNFAVLVLFTGRRATSMMVCGEGKLRVAGYTMFVCGSFADYPSFFHSVFRRAAA